jgi:hypothetical protein
MTARLEWLRRDMAPQALEAVRRVEGLLCAFPPDDDDAFAAIVMCDPSPRHVYVGWLLKILSKGGLRSEDLPRAMETLALFHAAKPRLPEEMRDIGLYASEPDLNAAISDAPVVQGFVEIPDDIRERSRILYEGPEGCVAVPLDLKASKWWGKDTRWCTTQEEDFLTYSRRGPIVVIVDADGAKHQVHGSSGQFCDSQDRGLNLSRILAWIETRPWSWRSRDAASAIWSAFLGRDPDDLRMMFRLMLASEGPDARPGPSTRILLRFMESLDAEQARAGIAANPGSAAVVRRFLREAWLRFRPSSAPDRSGSASGLVVHDDVLVASSPLHRHLDGALPGSVRDLAGRHPSVRRFLSGSVEETPPGSTVRIFRVATEAAAESWSDLYPEHDAGRMLMACRSGPPLRALVGFGLVDGEIAVASLAYPWTTSRASLETMLKALRPGGEGSAERPVPGEGRGPPQGNSSLFLNLSDILTLNDIRSPGPWRPARHTSRFAEAGDAVRRVAEDSMKVLASDPSGWRVRVSETRFAATVLLLQSAAAYGRPGERPWIGDCRNPLFYERDRHSFVGASVQWRDRRRRSSVDAGTVVEFRDPDGSRWVCCRAWLRLAGDDVGIAVFPLVCDEGVPPGVMAQMSGPDTGVAIQVDDVLAGLDAPRALMDFLADRPWLERIPGLRMALALILSVSGDREAAAAVVRDPTRDDMLLAAASDPLSLLSGVFGDPPAEAREVALEACSWCRSVLDGHTLEARRPDGSVIPLVPTRQGAGWKAFRLQGIPVSALESILTPAEVGFFRQCTYLPLPVGSHEERFASLFPYGEIILSVRAGACLVLPGSAKRGHAEMHLLSPGLRDIGRSVLLDPDCFAEGSAREGCLLHLISRRDPKAIVEHPFLHHREGGLRPEDILAVHDHAAAGVAGLDHWLFREMPTTNLFRMLLGMPAPPFALIRETLRLRPALLGYIPDAQETLLAAAADDLMAFLDEARRSGENADLLGSLDEALDLVGRVRDPEFHPATSHLLVHHTGVCAIRDYVAAFGPDMRAILKDAAERIGWRDADPDAGGPMSSP